MSLTMDDLRRIPVRYCVLASVLAFLLISGNQATPSSPYPHYAEVVAAFIAALGRLGGWFFVIAPVLALRWVLSATVVAAAPMVLIIFGDEHVWPFTAFCSLLAVALVGTWQSPRRALLPAGLALVYIVVLLTGNTTMVMPYGARIFIYPGPLAERVVTFAMFAVAVGVLFAAALWLRSSALRAQQEASLAARSAAVEEQSAVVGERARLARDLHDVVAHHVSLIAVRAETAPYTYPDLQPQARVVLGDIATDARSALDELRGVLGILRRADDETTARAPQPGLGEIAELVDRTRHAGATVHVEGDLLVPVTGATGYVAYRVVQEALTNARRHASGEPVALLVRDEGDELVVRVANPIGEASSTRPAGNRGLAGMRERVEAVGGHLEAGPQGADFVVHARLPKGDV